MISAATVDFAITIVIMVCMYLASVMTIGVVQALVAARFGDRSAIEEGYLSLDPTIYCDSFGLISLLIFGMGWTRNFPFRPELLQEPFRKAKVIAVHITQPILAFMLALGSVVGSVKLVGPSALGVIYQYTSLSTVFRSLNMQVLSELYGVTSSLLVVLIMLVSMAAINIFITSWSIVSHAWNQIIQYVATTYDLPFTKLQVLAFITPYLFFLFLFPILHYSTLKVVFFIASCAL